MESIEKKLLLKCFKGIEWEELYDPGVELKGRVALVFACDSTDDLDDDLDQLRSKLILCRWDVDRLTGESMWMEWDKECDGWHGPVENVIAWSWVEG